MGWLRKRFGETNTMAGAGMVVGVAMYLFPQYGAIIGAVGAALGVGGMVTPDSRNQQRE